MNKKQKIVIRNMISLSDILANTLDDRYKKLSDKFHELELSHNRKKLLLQDIEKRIKLITKYWSLDKALELELNEFTKKIGNELTYCGHVKGIF